MAYWKDTIFHGLEDNVNIVDAILSGAMVFVVFIYCLEYIGKKMTTGAEEGSSTIERGYAQYVNAGIESNCIGAATSNLSYDDRGYGDARSFNERAEATNDDDRRRDNSHREPYSRSFDDSECRHKGNNEVMLSKPDVDNELRAAGIQNKEYLALSSKFKEMRTRQIEMDKLVEQLRSGETASDRITSDSRRYDTTLDSSVTDSKRHFQCTRNYNSLKTDFDNLQKINEKLVHKYSAMKLRLGIIEREMTKNQSIVFSDMFCGRYSNFEGPATTGSYADGYYGQLTNHNVAYMSPNPLVRTNNVGISVSSSSGPSPPPPPPPTPLQQPPPPPSCPPPPPLPSCSPPPAAPVKKPNNSNSDVSDPALKVYWPIPITEEILKSVVLRKPTDVPPKIRVPVGMVPAMKKE